DKMLSSAEVGTLITALGCGIGRDDFDPDKLRYHRIIIMTDADVDGSHIRTLLLTFFYRQMLTLVERGHVYIAQPPLYKIKRGKQEHYVKDERELTEYLLQLALNNAAFYPGADAPAISGEALEDLARRYLHVMDVIEHMARTQDREFLEALMSHAVVERETFADAQGMQRWFQGIVDGLNEGQPQGTRYQVAVTAGSDGGFQEAVVSKRRHGIRHDFRFTPEFFLSPEYRAIAELASRLDGLLGPDSVVERGERSTTVSTARELVTWLLEEAKRNQNIQRYKGLGEMNPDQLWETTMNPETRRLLQVRIEDAVAADDVFTTLMGDHVEPRREFIERNALAATNIDI
ncbi:MAG: toprim domain-containing protein, partial [Ectothiorhodospiraceae bacterium]